MSVTNHPFGRSANMSFLISHNARAASTDPATALELLDGFRRSQLLFAAVRLGVFEQSDPCTIGIEKGKFVHGAMPEIAAKDPRARGSEEAGLLTEYPKPLPLSWQQMLIWRAPNRASHIIPPLTLRLVGPLDHHALHSAVSKLVARHEILRTTFHELPTGAPSQVVKPPFAVPIIETDLSAVEKGQVEVQARELLREHGAESYDLESLPLFRLGVIRLGEAEHILWFSLHHIVSDLWSTGILLKELARMYSTYHDSNGETLSPLRIQYSDYVTWQRDWLEREGRGELPYWEGQLADLPDVNLPTRLKEPARPTTGGICSLELPASLTAKIRELARSERTTPFMVLVAAFGVFLRRFVSGDSVAFEILLSYRTRMEWEPLIGMFAASSVFRMKLPYDHTFRQLLATVREVCMMVYSHSHLTFTKATELLSQTNPAQGYRRPGLLFTLQKTRSATPAFGGLRVSDLRQPGVTLFEGLEVDVPLWDQFWQVWDEGSSLRLAVIFKCDLFDAEIVARLLSQYRRVIELAIQSPGSAISR